MNSTQNAEKRGLIQAEDCALLIIDMQEKLLPVIAEREKVLSNIVKLVRFSRIMGIPTLVCEQNKLGPTVSEVQNELEAYDPIPKDTFNCFGTEAFGAQLEGLGRTTILVSGIEAHICVAQTSLTAPAGYRVHTVGDATSSRTLENAQAAAQRLLQAGVTVTTTEMCIFELLKRAGTEEFKQASKLVK
jgi:nicotinamidase-related amidase